MSALSAIGQDGQMYYMDGSAVNQLGSMITTVEVGSQTVVDEDNKREIEVQTDIKDVNGDLTPP